MNSRVLLLSFVAGTGGSGPSGLKPEASQPNARDKAGTQVS